MSVPEVPPSPPRPPRSMIVTALLLIGGVILILPGVCAAGYIASGLISPTPAILAIWAISFLIAWGGVALLRKAFQEPRGPRA